jgi:small GTP-binding protein
MDSSPPFENPPSATNSTAPSSENSSDLSYEILPEDYSQYDLSFKIIVIGDSGVGKSCLTIRATKNIFEDAYNATVGFEFFSFNIKMQGKVIKLNIWDTCGQELYRSLITNFYRNSSLAIMVYSINNKESFDNIDIWLKELRMHSNPDAKVFLIGNKADLEADRQVEKEAGEEYKEENSLNMFIETSAKNGFNAKEVFVEAAKILFDDYLKYKDKLSQRSSSIGSFKPMVPGEKGQEGKTLGETEDEKNKKCNC